MSVRLGPLNLGIPQLLTQSVGTIRGSVTAPVAPGPATQRCGIRRARFTPGPFAFPDRMLIRHA
jgi:hypothetical protein